MDVNEQEKNLNSRAGLRVIKVESKSFILLHSEHLKYLDTTFSLAYFFSMSTKNCTLGIKIKVIAVLLLTFTVAFR